MMEAGSLQPPVSPLVAILRTRTQIVAPGVTLNGRGNATAGGD
jgi:hypothetical protein